VRFNSGDVSKSEYDLKEEKKAMVHWKNMKTGKQLTTLRLMTFFATIAKESLFLPTSFGLCHNNVAISDFFDRAFSCQSTSSFLLGYGLSSELFETTLLDYLPSGPIVISTIFMTLCFKLSRNVLAKASLS